MYEMRQSVSSQGLLAQSGQRARTDRLNKRRSIVHRRDAARMTGCRERRRRRSIRTMRVRRVAHGWWRRWRCMRCLCMQIWRHPRRTSGGCMLRVAGWWRRREVARTVGEHGRRSTWRSSRNAVGVVGRLLVRHVGCGRSKPRCCRRGRRTRRRRCSQLSSTGSTGRGRGREGFAAFGASLPRRMRHQWMHSSSALEELHGQVGVK